MELLPDLTVIGISTYILIGMIRMYLIFVMGFSLKNKGIPRPILAPLFIFGFAYDIFLNYWLSIPTLDLPNEWDETITNRMKRYKNNEPMTWKGRFSFWMCDKLNRYDKGHC